MNKLSVCLLILFFSTGCTISLSLVNTHGTADDVIDSTPTTSTTTDAAVKIPAIGM